MPISPFPTVGFMFCEDGKVCPGSVSLSTQYVLCSSPQWSLCTAKQAPDRWLTSFTFSPCLSPGHSPYHPKVFMPLLNPAHPSRLAQVSTHFLLWAGFHLYQDPSFLWIPGIVLIIKAAMITAIIIKPYIRIVGASLKGSMGKNLPANLGDAGSISGPGRSPGEGNEYPFQYSCLENPNGQRSLAGYSPRGCQRVGHDLETKWH